MQKFQLDNSTIYIVMYHYVRKKEKRYPNLPILEYNDFKSQIDFFCKNCNILSKNDFLEIIHKKKIPHKPSIFLTFDDGYKCHYEFAFPYLLKKKISGSFYAPVEPIINETVLDVNKIHFILAKKNNPKKIIDNINNFLLKNSLKKLDVDKTLKRITKDGADSKLDDKYTNLVKCILQYILPKKIRVEITDYLFEKTINETQKEFSKNLYLNKNEIREMYNCGMDFGSHGTSHEYLALLNMKKQEKEIYKSMIFFKDLGLETENFSISYPYGSYNNDTLKILKKLKVKFAFKDKHGTINIHNINNYFTFPRVDTKTILNG